MKADDIIEIVDRIKKLRRAKDDFIEKLGRRQEEIKRIVENPSSLYIEINYKDAEDKVRWDSAHYNPNTPGTRVYMALLADMQLEAEQLCAQIKECNEEIEKLSKFIEGNCTCE